jgi:hypothetical protein
LNRSIQDLGASPQPNQRKSRSVTPAVRSLRYGSALPARRRADPAPALKNRGAGDAVRVGNDRSRGGPLVMVSWRLSGHRTVSREQAGRV